MLQENTSTKLAEFENRQLTFTTIQLNNGIVLVEEISAGGYTADTNINITNTISSKSRQYVTKNVAKINKNIRQ